MSAPKLSVRELTVLRMLAEGKGFLEIGSRLFIETGTVSTHVKRAKAKLGARTLPHAVHLAHLAGLLDGAS